MISSQRLIVMFLMINMIIGFGMVIYQDPSSYIGTQVNEELNILEETQTEFEEEGTQYGGIPSEDTSGEGKTIGNPFKMGQIVWTFWSTALNPWSIHPDMFQLEFEKIIATLLLLFRSIGTILLIIEAYLFLKNRKAT